MESEVVNLDDVEIKDCGSGRLSSTAAEARLDAADLADCEEETTQADVAAAESTALASDDDDCVSGGVGGVDGRRRLREPAGLRELVRLRFENPGDANQLPAAAETMAIPRAQRRNRRRDAAERPAGETDGGVVGDELHDANGHLILHNGSRQDMCDCLNARCPGCHFDCDKCGSRKCSAVCRRNRKFRFDRVLADGNLVIANPFY